MLRRSGSRGPPSASSRRRGVDPQFPQVQYSLGVAYFNAQQFDKAAPPLAQAYALEPSNLEMRRMLSLAWFNAEVFDKAAELLAADPGRESDPSLQYTYGLALVRIDRAADAEEIFSRLLAQHGDTAELHVVLGQANAQQGDYDAAIAVVASCAGAEADGRRSQRHSGHDLFETGAPRRGLDGAEGGARGASGRHQSPAHARDRARSRGTVRGGAVNPQAVFSRSGPTTPAPGICWARSCSPRVQAADAVEQLQAADTARARGCGRSLSARPGVSEDWPRRSGGRAVRAIPPAERQAAREGEMTAAMLWLVVLPSTVALRLNPRLPRRVRPRRSPARSAGDAAARAEGARGRPPCGGRNGCWPPRRNDSHRSKRCCSCPRLQSEDGDAAGALDSLRRARAAAPNSEGVLSAFAQMSLAAGAPVPAIRALESLTRICPTVAQHHYLLGVALMRAGDMPAAVEALRAADRLEPDRALTLVALGIALNNRQLYADAKPFLARSLALEPENVDDRRGPRRSGTGSRRARCGGHPRAARVVEVPESRHRKSRGRADRDGPVALLRRACGIRTRRRRGPAVPESALSAQPRLRAAGRHRSGRGTRREVQADPARVRGARERSPCRDRTDAGCPPKSATPSQGTRKQERQ